MSQSQDPRFDALPGLEEDYDQIQKVAIGGMAEVYRGRQKSLDRPVAIKRMKIEFQQSADLQKRFQREARSAANLLHHNLAHVYEYKVVGNESYIIMEYIDGFDLAQIQERVPQLPIDVAAMIAVKILHGLTQVHSHGMIHRDIKPDNVRVTTRGEVKIMDFGIAFDPGEDNLTQPGILIGSPHYLAPEQIQGEKLDSQADLFAFGITFYEMLCGRRPFFERDGMSVYSVIRSGKFDSIDSLRQDVPAFLANIVEKCLKLKPSDRPRSAESVAQILQEYLISEHSLSFEARIRKFLMEAQLMSGDPSLIDIGEKTDFPMGAGSGRVSKWVILVLVSLALWIGQLLALPDASWNQWLGGTWKEYIHGGSSDSSGQSTGESKKSKSKGKKSQSLALPGSPVEN